MTGKKNYLENWMYTTVDVDMLAKAYCLDPNRKTKWPEMMESFICLSSNRFPFICSFSMCCHTFAHIQNVLQQRQYDNSNNNSDDDDDDGDDDSLLK